MILPILQQSGFARPYTHVIGVFRVTCEMPNPQRMFAFIITHWNRLAGFTISGETMQLGNSASFFVAQH
ncbi:MAG: hypothetical protein ABL934_04370 [Lysobacteraceae bacterium]